ncbi:MAG: HAD family phosphatase [Ruthenibacterium sp.]
MYKNILFDLGGVVVDYAPRVFLVDLFANEALEQQLYDISFGSEEWKLLDTGSITREEGNDIMRKKAAAIGRGYEMEMILTDWADILRTKDDTMRLMKRLRQNGYKLYYLSNIAADTLADLRQRHFWPLFSGGVASCEAHIAKPDSRIFIGTLRKFRLNPAETIFIDDTAANVIAAQESGIQALQFTSCTALTHALKNLGIVTERHIS